MASFSGMARADGRDADAGAVHRTGVDLRAQVRRHPAARIQEWRRRPACFRAITCRRDMPSVVASDQEASGMTTRFSTAKLRGAGGNVTYHVFDVMWLDGRDLTSLPLDERRAAVGAVAVAAAASSRESDRPMTSPWERAQKRRLGRRHREATRLAVRTSPIAKLAEDEVRAVAGLRRRRLHGSARQARWTRRASGWSLRRTTTLFSRERSELASIRQLLLDLRARLDNSRFLSRRSPKLLVCRVCVRTGCSRRSWSRSGLSNGPCTASFVTRVC